MVWGVGVLGKRGKTMVRYVVTLSGEEREWLACFCSREKQKTKMVLHGLILLACDRGEFQARGSKNEEVARVLGVDERTVERVKKRFVEGGVEAALVRKYAIRQFPGKVDGDMEARIVALCCSHPPEGFARWSLRLLADKVVELNYLDSISHETVRKVLKKRAQALAEEAVGDTSEAER
jgi:transposase